MEHILMEYLHISTHVSQSTTCKETALEYKIFFMVRWMNFNFSLYFQPLVFNFIHLVMMESFYSEAEKEAVQKEALNQLEVRNAILYSHDLFTWSTFLIYCCDVSFWLLIDSHDLLLDLSS